ncbi:LapA family protein [Ferrimonas gelatinilytica]|uniref:Probable lipopolysaccharide assembly protein A n=1 Tax=Ferrimonas gelatinilytica TaxID=1255257 RepID=A0ABP9RXT7_9GAMM
MKAFLVAACVAALFVLALAFGARNEQMVTINYFIAQGTFPLPWVLAATFLLGFLISWVLSLLVVVKLKLALRRARAQYPRPQDQNSPNTNA